MMWRAICILLALSPTYLVRFHVGGIPFTLFESLTVVLTLVVAVRAFLNRDIRSAYRAQLKKISWPVWVALVVFVLAGVLSVLIAPELRAALGIFRSYIVEALCIGALVFLEYREPSQLRELVLWSSITVFFVSAYAIFQMVTGYGIPNPYWAAAATRRATSVFGYPNAIGLYVEFLIPFLVSAGFVARGWMRRWLWFVAALSIVGFLSGKSAGATAAVFGTLIIFLFVWKQTRVRTALVIAAAALLIVVTPLRHPFAQQFLLQGFSGGLRIQMWKETVRMLHERPIVGAGLAGYQARVAPFHTNKRVEIYLYPHNLILTLWSELGLAGLFSFGFVFGYVVWLLLRGTGERVWRLSVLACFSIWFIHGIVDIPYFKNDFAAWYWAVVALGLHLGYTKNS